MFVSVTALLAIALGVAGFAFGLVLYFRALNRLIKDISGQIGRR